jgi:transcriptional regulator with XRE-family HTH domain
MTLADQIASSPERMKNFQRERLATEITELICRLMIEKKVTRAELASRLGKSRPYVTKLLGAGTNLTVRTLSDVFHALGCSLRVVDTPLSVVTGPLGDSVLNQPVPSAVSDPKVSLPRKRSKA